MSDTAGEKVQVIRVTAIGNDAVAVDGLVNGVPVRAYGWHSATTNHYPNDTRDDAGHRPDDAQPREMTDDEKQAYWRSLLTDAAPTETVLFESETP